MIHKFLKTISQICIMVFLIIYAIQPDVLASHEQTGVDGIRLYGNTECKKSDCIICIDVWAHNKSVSDLKAATNKSDYTDIIVYRLETVSGVNGVYDVTFELGDRDSGVYDAYISCECCQPIKEEVVFSNAEANRTAIGYLNAAVKGEDTDIPADATKQPYEEIKRLCETYKYDLGFVSDYAVVDYAAKLICKYITQNGELDINNKEAAIALYNKAVAVAAVESGELTNLFAKADMFEFENGRLSTLYKEEFVTDIFGTYVTGKLSGIEFESLEKFDGELCKQFVFGAVRYGSGWKDIQKTATVFKTDIGLTSIPTETQCLKVWKKEYTSYTDLCRDMIADGSGGNIGGAGNGASQGSGLGRVEYSSDYVKQEGTEKINKNIFNDIDDVSWAIEPIVELAQKGIISGKGNGLFCPNDNITREEFVKIIMMTFFADAEPAQVMFFDVDESAWYAKYVKMAYGENVVNGIGDGLFGTGRNITREDMAVIAYRTAIKAGKLSEDVVSTERTFVFDDDSNISEYAKNSVYALYEVDVINGMNESEFAPKQPLTRAQAAKIIYGIYTLR